MSKKLVRPVYPAMVMVSVSISMESPYVQFEGFIANRALNNLLIVMWPACFSTGHRQAAHLQGLGQ
jgi:hypothetical protein